MKKLLMGILALTLALSFTACGEDSKKDSDKEETKQTETKNDNKKEADPKDAAEDAVKGFMDAFCEFDFKEMEKYIDGELPAEFAEFDFSTIKEETVNSLPEELDAYKDDFGKMFDTAIDKMLATISYDITNVKEDGDNYVISVDVTMADFNALEESLNNALTSDLSDKIVEIGEEAMENGDLSDDSTEQEVMDYLIPKAIDMIGDLLEDEIKNLERTTEEGEFVVTEVDGEWLINIEESSL